jgi:hypothetical protein
LLKVCTNVGVKADVAAASMTTFTLWKKPPILWFQSIPKKCVPRPQMASTLKTSPGSEGKSLLLVATKAMSSQGMIRTPIRQVALRWRGGWGVDPILSQVVEHLVQP